MLRPRIIPCLLVHEGGLVKTVGFSAPKYVGDPINAVKIFNEKEADELVVLDIDATVLGQEGANWKVRCALGDILVTSAKPLTANSKVTVSVRPEDVELSEGAVDGKGGNICAGTVDNKVFLGDIVDFQVKVGDHVLQARAHPSLTTAVGGKLNLRMDPKKCIALPEDGPAPAAPH